MAMLEQARGGSQGCDMLLSSLHCPRAAVQPTCVAGTSGPDHQADPSRGGSFLLGPPHCVAGPSDGPP